MRTFMLFLIFMGNLYSSPRKIIKDDIATLNSISLTAHNYYDFWEGKNNESYEELDSDTFFAHVSFKLDNDSLVFWMEGNNSQLQLLSETNLDSITSIEVEQFKTDIGYGYFQIFRVDINELESLKGSCYILKTTDEDPRLGYAQYHVKLKILDFTINDLEARDVDMKFLWMANYGGTDLTTEEPIDTFGGTHVSKSVSSISSKNSTENLVIRGSSITLPKAFENTKTMNVYNVRGQRVFSKEIEAGVTNISLPSSINNNINYVVFK